MHRNECTGIVFYFIGNWNNMIYSIPRKSYQLQTISEYISKFGLIRRGFFIKKQEILCASNIFAHKDNQVKCIKI